MLYATMCKVKEGNHKRSCIVRLHLYEMFKVGNPTETESRLVVAQGQELGGRVMTDRHVVSFWIDENVLKLDDVGEGCTIL